METTKITTTIMDIVAEFKNSLPVLNNIQLNECFIAISNEICHRLNSFSKSVVETPSNNDSDFDNEDESDPSTESEDEELQPEIQPELSTPITILTEYHVRTNITEVLDRYEPTTVNKHDFIQQTELLLELVAQAPNSRIKASIARHLFRLIKANLWVMENSPRFRNIVSLKIIEFETDPKKEAREIAREYNWLKEWPYKLYKCSYCSASCAGEPDDDDDDHFCNEEHRQIFAQNGDCAHKPSITKDQLDLELDEYNNDDPRKSVVIMSDYDPAETERRQRVMDRINGSVVGN